MAKKKTPEQIFRDKVKYLLKAEEDTAKSVIRFQRALYELILSEYLPLFELKDGLIADSAKNTALVNQIDNYFNKLESAMHKDVLSVFVKGLLDSVTLSGEYYVAMGFRKKVVNNIIKNKVNVEAKLGITPKGQLRKDGYIYQLGQTPEVRRRLKKYVIDSLTGDTSFLDFQLGFRNLVLGNKRVKSLATTGVLERYFDQFAYDSFNAVDAAANNQIAHNLDLKHFTYEGSLIKTSRKFCEKRAGKAFKVSETKTWKNDPDLIDKKTKDSYRPLIDRGRYRCRHFIKYITEELYNVLVKKQNTTV